MRRRTFLKRIGKLTVALGFPHSLTKQGFAAMLPTDLTSLSAIDLSEAIRAVSYTHLTLPTKA